MKFKQIKNKAGLETWISHNSVEMAEKQGVFLDALDLIEKFDICGLPKNWHEAVNFF
jgi:hypothetical protein